MKFVIIVTLIAALATAENVGAAEQNQRLLHIIAGAIAGLLNPRPVIVGPAIVDQPIESPVWDGPLIIDSPVGGGPVIAEYPVFDSPISVGPAIINEPVDTDAPVLIPQPVFPFPIASPLVQVILNVDSDSASNAVSIEQPISSADNLVEVSPVIIPGQSGINPRQA